MAAVNIENMEPFGRLRNKVAEFYDNYLDRIAVHFQWLDEILGETEQAFKKPDVELLPTTPSEKRKRGRVKRGTVQKRVSSVKKRSSARTSRKSPTLVKVKMGILEFGEESETNGSLSPQASEAGTTNVPSLQMDTVEENELEKEPRKSEGIPKDKGTSSAAVRLENDSVSIESSAVEIPEDQIPVTLMEKTFQVDIEATENNEEENGEPMEIASPRRRSSPQQQQEALVVPNDGKMSMEPRTPEPIVQTARTAVPATLQLPSKLPISASGKKGKLFSPLRTPHLTPTATRVTPAAASGGATRSVMLLRFKEAAAKREDLLKQKIEEQKRKREERTMKVAQQRQQQKAREDELKWKIEQKYQMPPTLGSTVRSRSPSPFASAKPKDCKPKQQEDNSKEKTLYKSEANNETMGMVTRQKLSRPTFVVPPENASINQTGDIESYDMTPLRQLKPSTASNYDISDLQSSDETDDEEHPRKKVPAWAQGGSLKSALTQQFYNQPDLDGLFGVVDTPDLSKMFKVQRKRFYKRTSSAKWDSPIRPHQDS